MARSPSVIPLCPPNNPIPLRALIEAAHRVPPADLRREIFRQMHMLEQGDLDGDLTAADLRRWVTSYALIHKLVFGLGQVPEDPSFLL